jgi:hypothetical protein
LRDRLWLVKNGVPYDVAFALPVEDVAAYGILFGEMEGGKFDWSTWQWAKKDGQ